MMRYVFDVFSDIARHIQCANKTLLFVLSNNS